jgi:hypothetical protein
MVRIALIMSCLGLLAACSSDDAASDPWTFTDAPGEEPLVDDPPQTADGEHVVPDVDVEPDPDPDSPNSLPQDDASSWAGLWLVDQPNHALYEGTLYDFRADGSLVEGESVLFDGSQDVSEVGTVGKCVETDTESYESCSSNGNACERIEYVHCVRFEPTCTFGERWGAVGHTLLIKGDCSDNTPRVIELTFPDDADLDNGQWLVPQSIIVEGDPWEHNWWDWAWHRCEGSADECLPLF